MLRLYNHIKQKKGIKTEKRKRKGQGEKTGSKKKRKRNRNKKLKQKSKLKSKEKKKFKNKQYQFISLQKKQEGNLLCNCIKKIVIFLFAAFCVINYFHFLLYLGETETYLGFCYSFVY